MKRFLLAALLVAHPLYAQDSARVSALEARIAKLEQAMGPYGDSIPPAADFPARCTTLPNGRYSVWCRVQQIGVGIDDNSAAVNGMRVQLAGFATRLAAVEARPSNGGDVAVPTVEGGTLYVPNKIIIGRPSACPPDANAMLQICGERDASILTVSNANGLQYQNAAKHVGMWSMSSDGGMRIIQNGYTSINSFEATDPTNGVKYQNSLFTFIDPTREYSATGVDSRGTWSFLRTSPGQSKDYTQDVVLRFYPDQKIVAWESWQIGWNWQIRSSTCRVCADRITNIQPQQ
jgi:hypothetical protein